MSSLEKVEEKILKHSEKVVEAFKEFKIGLIRYIKNGMDREVENHFERVHSLEDEADAIRRETIREILEGNLLNTTSADFLKLTESIDKIANKSEKFIDRILENKIDKTILDVKVIEDILEITMLQVRTLDVALKNIFIDFDKAYEKAKSLEISEDRIDTLEMKYLTKLRNMDIELSKKLYYRDFINMVANISDIIEDVGDEIEKISIIRGM
ncbi:MAG: DUF47 domain-containing protein [Fusobacteriota bacterium]